MYSSHPHESQVWNGEKKFRLADFFDKWWDIYKAHPAELITEQQYKAVNSLRVCRTEALGVDYYACPNCGEVTKVYHSCKNRFCPTCSWQDTLKWADRIKEKMMAIPHRHVIMTLPHQLNDLIKENKYKLLSVLMRTAADTFKDWIEHRYNIRPGIISVLHTFGEVKQYHVHVHMIVSWGGIKQKTYELQEIENEYVNYDFLKNKFRKKFEDELVVLFNNGDLDHGFTDKLYFLRFIKLLNKHKWNIHLEPPMLVPTQVIRYIGRYSKRACLSEYKVTKMEGEVIAFKYKDNKTKDEKGKAVEGIIELNYREFFPRLLQHVPEKYFRVVRYYGMYSNRANIPEEYLYREEENKEESVEDWETLQIEKTGQSPLTCKHCNTRKVYIYTRLKSRKNNKTITFERVIFKKTKRRKSNAA